ISLFGLPVYPYVRSTPVEEYRRRYNNLVQTGQMNEQFFYEIAKQQKVLCDEKFYRESVEAADLAIEALVHLSDPIKRAEAAVYVWSLKGVAFSGLGNYSQAISCYLQALSAWVDDLYASQAVYYRPGLRREMAFMYARIDDFEHALTALSDAQTELATLDPTDPKNREE